MLFHLRRGVITMKTSKCFTVLIVLLALQVTEVKAANLVTNPDFTSDVSGWTPVCPIPVGGGTPGTLTWDSSDGDPAPGSAHSLGCELNSTCIVMAAPQNIDLSANIKVAAAAARAVVNGFSDVACTTGETYGIAVTPIASNSAWQTVSMTDVALPIGTNSVEVQLQISSTSDDIHFDHILFGPSNLIFYSGFEGP
jgi:hypothetical protein